ncbi:helicase [Chromatiales bacterium (ex Bugula neritina AB1)]|nr:helicase [Chromatiales bacterium (ex Bugula neritina AB1)]
MATQKESRLSLTDKLSHLNFQDACKLLGPEGSRLIIAGSKFEIDSARQIQLTARRFTLRFEPPDNAVVTIQLSNKAKRRLNFTCSHCESACEHVGAALSFILEEKVVLGLAQVPDLEDVNTELSDEELIERELQARKQRADTEKMRVRSADSSKPWTDYEVSSKASGKTYRVALRGMQRGDSYCSCPDFRKNTLGTCKHVMQVQRKVQRRFSERKMARKFKLQTIIVYLDYTSPLSLRVAAPDTLDASTARAIKPFLDKPVTDLGKLVRLIARLEAKGTTVTVYPDAEEYIEQRSLNEQLQKKVAEIRATGTDNPLRRTLLKTELLPYQFEGVLFATAAGRAILADDMGLGKTIQGVGVAELLARLAGIRKALVVCPASLKTQWRSEISRFCERDCQVVVGTAADRAEQYSNDAFFTICNYEQVLRDLLHIERNHWDLIILDEGQRIKNWESKTSRVIKSLRSTFALVLSGTPMENRIDELYSVIEFIDERRLGPGFRFYNQHRVVDERGKVLGYRNLAQLRENLKPILLRRTRASVLKELPPRSTEIMRIAPTQEQEDLHGAHMRIVSSILSKSFYTEMDLLRLQKALLMCRLSADSTQLVDKKPPGYSSKLEVTDDLLARLGNEEGNKTVLFSEWTTMLGFIEAQLQAHGIGYVRLDGSVPQQKRGALVRQFEQDDNCRFFLATNAGSTGLNLQFANTVVNIDLPWNPAILEQRIGRVHRMGQTRPVQVYILVTIGTIEENLLATLAAKHELSTAALDMESEVDEVDLSSGIENLKKRLEILLGAKPEASVDESQKKQTGQQAAIAAQREQLNVAGGQLMGAAFNFIGQMLPAEPETPRTRKLTADLLHRFEQCVETDDQGRPKLTVTLPDQSSLKNLAESIARMMASAKD